MEACNSKLLLARQKKSTSIFIPTQLLWKRFCKFIKSLIGSEKVVQKRFMD